MRVYTVNAEDITIANATTDMLEILNSSGMALVVLACRITQNGSTAAGQTRAVLKRRTTTGSGGSSADIRKKSPGDAAASFTANKSVTTQGTSGDTLWSEAADERAGWYYQPIPEERDEVPPSGRIAVCFADAPSVSLTVTVTLTLGEIG